MTECSLPSLYFFAEISFFACRVPHRSPSRSATMHKTAKITAATFFFDFMTAIADITEKTKEITITAVFPLVKKSVTVHARA